LQLAKVQSAVGCAFLHRQVKGHIGVQEDVHAALTGVAEEREAAAMARSTGTVDQRCLSVAGAEARASLQLLRPRVGHLSELVRLVAEAIHRKRAVAELQRDSS